VVSVVSQAIRLCWQADRKSFVQAVALQTLGGVLLAVLIGATQLVLEALLRRAASDLVLPLALLACATLGATIAQGLTAGRSRRLIERVMRFSERHVLDVARRVPLLTFEDPAFHDAFARAHRQSFSTIQISMGVLRMAEAAFASIGIAAILVRIQPVLVFFVVIAHVPGWFAARRGGEDLFSFSIGNTPEDRGRQAIEGIVSGPCANVITPVADATSCQTSWECGGRASASARRLNGEVFEPLAPHDARRRQTLKAEIERSSLFRRRSHEDLRWCPILMLGDRARTAPADRERSGKAPSGRSLFELSPRSGFFLFAVAAAAAPTATRRTR
jgi:hypothetical protein